MASPSNQIRNEAVGRALRRRYPGTVPTENDYIRAEDELRILAATERAAELGRISPDVVSDPAYLASIMDGMDLIGVNTSAIALNTSDTADAGAVGLEFWSRHDRSSARAMWISAAALLISIISAGVTIVG